MNHPTKIIKTANEAEEALRLNAEAERAAFLPGFFKAMPGGYGEGDLFLGVRVPLQRKVAGIAWKNMDRQELIKLLRSPYHECRLTALFILVRQFEKVATESERESLVGCYLNHLDFVNNWDLVDSSAYQLLGAYLYNKDRSLLYELAGSGHLWRQRVAMIATYYLIKKHVFGDTLRLSVLYLNHPHDLIHKASGWMIREVGKRDFQASYDFLKKHYQNMPRTMLRYAIEKYPGELRKKFLKGEL